MLRQPIELGMSSAALVAQSRCWAIIGMARVLTGVSRDVSMLRQPIELGMSSAAQVAQGVHFGTQEVHDMLVYECDLIFECRVSECCIFPQDT